MLDPSITHALDTIAQDLKRSRDVSEVLTSIVASARESMSDIDHVGISLSHRDGHVETLARTDDLVLELDQLQQEVGEGPHRDAVAGSVPAQHVRVDNARHEQRWPRYIPRAVQLGLRSQLGFGLVVGQDTTGSLNLYSTSVDRISEESGALAQLFATHAALALGWVRTEQSLTAALETRSLIGQATGIMMERYDLGTDHAFDYLVRVSQTSNTKMRELAAQLVAEFDTRKAE
ncbi:transcriptional regulator with GAF, ATPase, and Fis domain [Marmoricola sp. OAE513]|uniref:ANTAR domain-containing protein n=1 Tax=Marmoricola sp. OAE513 TaxID=2817894 RepID=UPI001AEA6260